LSNPQFKLIPAWITPDGRKVPLIKDWQNLASNDPEQQKLWQDLYRERLKFWAIPTGPVNGILVLDVDVKDNGYETLKQFAVPNTFYQRTISGGLHLFFKYPNDGKTYGNRVKFLPGLDTRGVGGYVMWYGTEVGTAPIADAPEWLCTAALKSEHSHVGSAVKVDPSIAEKIVLESLERIREASPGESNNVLNKEAFALGQLVASGSITKEYAEQALLKAATERGKPLYESKATITSGLDGGQKKPITSPFGDGQPQILIDIPPPPGPPERWTPRTFSRSDLLNHSNLKKPQLFQDWSTEDIHITTADGGTGKTTLKLFEAICLALGERFLGFNCVTPGKTLFITGEDTAAKLGAMIGAILRQMGLFEDHPGNNEKVQQVIESIVVKKDADLCLIVKDKSHFIHPSTEAMRKILEAVDDIKPKMIVFDPISSFWGSEAALNDMNKAVTKFMSELTERSKACVEMVNHMGKASSASKDMSQFAGRGGSGLPSNARVSRVLRSVFEEEYMDLTGETLTEKQSAMMCMVNKFSDGSPLYNKPFLILRDGFLFTRKNLLAIKQKEAEEQLTDIERVFTFVKDARSSDRYPTLAVIIGHFMACGNPMSEAKVKRAVTMLQYSGHMGELLKPIENPDQSMKDKAFVITDMEGREA
jgi:RecA-family ATPase